MEKTFEQKMQELDEIVAKLEESKGLDLNEVAALYKRGKDHSKEYCYGRNCKIIVVI